MAKKTSKQQPIKECKGRQSVLCLNMDCSVCEKRRVPYYLIEEFVQELNSGIDIRKIPYKSKKMITWKCKNKEHPTFEMVLQVRTREKNPGGCKQCGKYCVPGKECTEYQHGLCLNMDCSICEKRRVPDYLIEEFVQELNPGIDIRKRSSGADDKIIWKCKNVDHPTFEMILHERTREKDPRGCPQCGNHYMPGRVCKEHQHGLCLNRNCSVCEKRRVPDYLIEEFVQELNPGIDILKLPCGADNKITWKCKNEEHPTFEMVLYSRTRENDLRGCHQCTIENRNRITAEERAEREEKGEKSMKHFNNILIGEATERYVIELLSKNLQVKSIELIGQFNGYTDVIVELKEGIKRLLQIKTISPKSDRYKFGTHLGKWYPDNLLIAGVDTKRQHFMVGFSGLFTSRNVSVSFKPDTKSKYKDLVMTNENEFIDRILRDIINSTNFISVEDQLNERHTKEYLMVQRLINACNKHGLELLTSHRFSYFLY